jgi:hypothetical protein
LRLKKGRVDVADDHTQSEPKPLVFFHIMKCGGTSVRAGLATGAAGKRTGPKVFELDGAAAKAAAGGALADEWQFRDALLPYALTAMHPAVVLGHFRYRDRYADFADRSHFVTVLRDPVERMVSLYKWRRYKEGIAAPLTRSFDQLVSSGRWAKQGQAYVETFRGRDDLPARSDEAADAAVANLRRFAVVGFIDRLEEFSEEVSACLGRPVAIPVLNRSPAPPDTEIDAGMRERAKVLCAPDYRVYNQLLADRG